MVVQSQFIEMFGDTFQNERGWTYKKLPEVSTIVLGSTPSSSNAAFWDGDVKWITPAELSDDSFYLYDSERHITEEGVKSTSLKPFPAGTVILSTRAPIGKTAIAGCEMYCNQGFKNFVCDNTINPVYLFYSLRIHNPELQKMGTGSTFLELSKKAIEQISISVPPKELQDEFEQFYKQADKSKFDGLKSQFIEMFGALTSDRRLADVVKIYDGVHQTPHYTSAGIRFISVEDISDIYGSNKYISKEDYDKYKHVPEKGDLIMTRIGTIGQCAVVSKTEPLAYYVSVTLIKPDQEVIDSTYLKYYIESGYGQNELRMRSLLEAFPMKINLNEIGKISLKIPSKEAQLKFVEVVNRADKSKYLS